MNIPIFQIDDQEEKDILSVEQALDKLRKRIILGVAGDQVLISECELCEVIMPFPNGIKEKIIIIPVWVFKVEEDWEDEEGTLVHYTRYYYVNAVTGEVYNW